jgi:pimeloyl-ACP methyl ester carboxylesterase
LSGGRTKVVATVVVGGDEDKLTPPWHAHHIGDLLQNCEEVRVIPGLGHMGPLEVPKTLAELVDKLVVTHISADPKAQGRT